MFNETEVRSDSFQAAGGGLDFCNSLYTLVFEICYFHLRFHLHATAAWPNWIRRLTTDQAIAGSSPAAVICF